MDSRAFQVRLFVQALLLSTGIVVALFVLQGHKGLSLWDEGYLWYGAQRVFAGEVPIRDFHSYDPGRYYWVAAVMSLRGDSGIISLRTATAVFQMIGLSVGSALLALGMARQDRSFWVFGAITLAVWMAPVYRLFDNCLPYFLIGALAVLVQQPSTPRFFLAGLTVGLCAVFGRNHGVYGAVGSLGVMAYLGLGRGCGREVVKGSAVWFVGVAVGFSPVLAMLAVVPGFAQSFWESIRFLFEFKSTNLPLPVPWPWRADFGKGPAIGVLRELVLGLFFIAIIAFGVIGIAWSFRQRLRNKALPAVFVASAMLALPYAHYAFSRADSDHLGPGIPPFLVGCFLLAARCRGRIKWPLAVLLCAASLLVMLRSHTAWACYRLGNCVDIAVGGALLRIDPATAADLEMLRRLADRYAPNGRSFIATPFWPGAYAALGRRSPMWEIYALFPRSEAFQRAEIERIKAAKPGFAVIFDLPLDGNEHMRFRNSHPLIDGYIAEHFEVLPGYSRTPLHQVYRSRQSAE